MIKEQREFMIKLAKAVEELTERVDFIAKQLVDRANIQTEQKLEPGFNPDGSLKEISIIKGEKENNVFIEFSDPNRTIQDSILVGKTMMESIIKLCAVLGIKNVKLEYTNKI